MPPIAGAISWTNGLLDRIRDPMERLQGLSQSLQDREEYKDVVKLYCSLEKQLTNEYIESKLEDWCRGVEENTDEQLLKFLLVREETELAEEGFIRVNFDPILVRYLREVKYLLLQDYGVPERAQSLFDKVDTYRRWNGRLDLIVEMYNNIIATLLPVEKPLMMDRIEKMNKALQAGIDTLKWNSDNIDPFISQAMVIVTDVNELVKKIKENVSKMIEIMNQWSETPLFQRKNKTQSPEDVEQLHNASVSARFDQIRGEGKEIHKLMKDTTDNVRPNKQSKEWKSYIDYVNGLVIEGITNGIDSSMTYLAEQINFHYNATHALAPIFDIKVALADRQVQFDPSIECNDRQNGIRDIINSFVEHFISLAIQMPQRLDSPTGDYLVEIKDQFQLFGKIQRITDNLDFIEGQAFEFLNQYSDISFLWEKDLETSFQTFLNEGADVREIFLESLKAQTELEEDQIEYEIENYDAMQAKILEGCVSRYPDLEVFDAEITKLHEYKSRIDSMKTSADIGWLKVNVNPLKNQLQEIIKDWTKRYTTFLLDNTVKQLTNIQDFIKQVSEGIKVLPKDLTTERDKNLLTKVMTHLRDVTQIHKNTIKRFPHLRETILLLKKHGEDVSVSKDKGVDLLVTIENARTALEDTADTALGPIKEAILPLQSKESDNVKHRVRAFQIKVFDYRLEFQSALPYGIKDTSPEIISSAYDKISEYYAKTCEMEEEAKQLQVLEQLFELQRTKQKELGDCKSELGHLKHMWDLIQIIDG
jgi:dynein heavy chain